MGRPAKIHKKKSFMFTSKHTSFLGVLGLVIAVISIVVTIASVIYSYNLAGNVNIGMGGVGLFEIIMNVLGIIAGAISLNERDVYKTPGIISIVVNSFIIVGWVLLIVISL